MGSDLVAEFDVARDVYAKASDVLGYDLAELSFEDADGKLDLTRYTQPALMAHQIACLEALRRVAGDIEPFVCAGHSLGEYTALVAAGALSLEDGIALVAASAAATCRIRRSSPAPTRISPR